MKHLLTQHKVAFTILLFVVIVLFYPFSIFFRGTIVPLYVNTFYRGSVKTAYANAFTDLNKQLSSLGFVIKSEAPTCYNGVSDNGNAWFHYWRETVPCMKESTTEPRTADNDFKARWLIVAPYINDILEKDEWHFYSSTPIKNLFQLDGQSTFYKKSFDKYQCYVTFEYSNYSGKPSTDSNTKAYVFESCTRNVSFFGGYID